MAISSLRGQHNALRSIGSDMAMCAIVQCGRPWGFGFVQIRVDMQGSAVRGDL